MAKIATQTLVVELATVVKKDEPETIDILTDDVKESIEQVIQQLIGEKFVVELTVVE
jgi:hypothetical protein